MKRRFASLAPTLSALLLGACASSPRQNDPALQLRLDSQLAPPQRAVLPGLNSDFTLGSADGLLHYRAGYQVQPGQMFAHSATPIDTPSQQVAVQTLGHNAGVRLTELAGAPLLLGLQYQQQAEWQLAGEAQNAQRALNLGWAPAIAAFDLKWSNSSAAAAPLDCALEGTMHMPLPAEALALKLRGRSCRVVRDAADSAELDARTWSAALEWSEQQQRSTLRLQAIDPVPAAGFAAGDPAPGYELGVMREQSLGEWSAQTRVAWRRVPDAGNPELSEGWSSDASLQRRLRTIGVSAGLSSGVNPLWFVPDAAQRSQQLNLGLDLSRWAGSMLPGLNPATGVFYRRTQTLGTEQRQQDDLLEWKFSLLW